MRASTCTLTCSPGGSPGGCGLLRHASIIVRPRSQSRIPREVAHKRQLSCGCVSTQQLIAKAVAAVVLQLPQAHWHGPAQAMMRPTAGGPGGRRQLGPRRLRMKMTMK